MQNRLLIGKSPAGKWRLNFNEAYLPNLYISTDMLRLAFRGFTHLYAVLWTPKQGLSFERRRLTPEWFQACNYDYRLHDLEQRIKKLESAGIKHVDVLTPH